MLAVACGAFAAHGLEGRVPAIELSAFHTAAQYHMYHALALLAVAGLAAQDRGHPGVALAGWGFLGGIVFFCGSLYWLGASASRSLVFLTPFGGLLFLAGWAGLIWTAKKSLRR